MKHAFTLATLVLVFIVAATSANCQAPAMKSTANFVLFTSFGAISNSGASLITGKVGSNSVNSTGFGNVDGTLHAGDGATAAAKSDLVGVYNTLNTAVATIFPTSPIGGGATVGPGVYSVTGATVLDGTIYLDAGGNQSAVFIFQFGGAFSTTAAASVELVNGTQACNVFWKAEGKVTLAAGTVMRGTVLANNAAIDMSTGCTLEGRALATNGNIAVNKLTAFIPMGCGRGPLNGPASPDLGTAASFGAFTTDGNANNIGASVISGAVGTNVGAATGFDAATVSCVTHTAPDAATGIAAADVVTAYNYINALTDDIELLAPSQLGGGLTLTPHTYVLKSPTTLTGTLILNAQGNGDAVFVIKVRGSFSATSGATITLTNSAQAKNVYWIIDGNAEIGTNVRFSGAVIVNNGNLTIRGGAILTGRALVKKGALTIQNATITNVSTGSNIEGFYKRSFCKGDTVVLRANEGTSYTWNSGERTRSITVRTAGTYNVIVDNSIGCIGTSPDVIVTIDSVPQAQITASGRLSFCKGDSVFLTANAGTRYLWSTNDTTQRIRVDTSGTYTVTVFNARGCSSVSAAIKVSANKFPSDSITASGPTTFCGPGTVTLFADKGAKYLWNTGAITQGIIVNKTGDYKVTITSDSGCVTNSKSRVVIVHAPADATVTLDGPADLCQGSTLTLTAPSNQKYLWTNGDTTQSIQVTEAGSYGVQVTTLQGCMATSLTTTVTVKTVQHGQAVTQTADTLFSPYDNGNVWYKVGSPNSVGSGKRIVCNGSGDYYVTATVDNGCTATSDTLSVVCLTSGVAEDYLSSTLSVSPNPTAGTFNISYTLLNEAMVTINLYSVIGNKMAEILPPTVQSGQNKASFDASQLNAGIYFVETLVNGSSVITKVVVSK